MEFKRKVYDKMLKWKNEYAPNYALFLKGARRVGKSTLALKLGKEEYKSFIEIRFDKAPNEIKELFVNSLEDLDYLFNKLQIFYKTRLYVRESLIILDEIQLFPEARIIGLNLSGLEITNSIFKFNAENIFLTGGNYGIESSVITTIVLSIMLLVIKRQSKLKK